MRVLSRRDGNPGPFRAGRSRKVTAMSKTDKTAPFHVKQAEHPDEWWRPEFRCTCPLCKEPQRQASRRRRREEKRQLCDWRREYE